MRFSPQEIAEITQAEIQKIGNVSSFQGVAIDSRSLKREQLL